MALNKLGEKFEQIDRVFIKYKSIYLNSNMITFMSDVMK